MKKTKIVCTLGPASSSEKIITEMALKGMDVARLNMSHANHDKTVEIIGIVKKVRKKLGRPIAILADLQGPRIRTGKVEGGKVELRKGSVVLLNNKNDFTGSSKEFSILYPPLTKELKKGDSVFIDGGLIELKIEGKEGGKLVTEVMAGGVLQDHKGVNLPNANITLPSITPKDSRDLRFLKKQGVDYVAQSFVRFASDVEKLKKIVSGWKNKPRVIAKIETAKALDEIDSIISASDGIMVARGDLGVELKPEEVPIVQKNLIKKCNLAYKPVITATQMLESMIQNPVPTRAEASDVANAVFDGSDAVMLSGETAVGKYPIDTVEMMATIARKAESVLQHSPRQFFELEHRTQKESITEAISSAVTQTAVHLRAKLIVAHTTRGFTARLISKHKPPQKIIAFTPNENVYQQCALLWGVEPVLLHKPSDLVDFTRRAQKYLLEKKMVEKGDVIVITAGIPFETGITTNVLKVHVIS